jgi:hypothetical protein
MLGQNDASLRPDLPAFERSGARKRRSGPKTLDQQAISGDPDVKRHATWGMSGYTVGHVQADISYNYIAILILRF